MNCILIYLLCTLPHIYEPTNFSVLFLFFCNESWTRHSVNTEFRTQTTSVKPQKPGHHKITTKPHPPLPHMAEGDVIIHHISSASVSYRCQLCGGHNNC